MGYAPFQWKWIMACIVNNGTWRVSISSLCFREMRPHTASTFLAHLWEKRLTQVILSILRSINVTRRWKAQVRSASIISNRYVVIEVQQFEIFELRSSGFTLVSWINGHILPNLRIARKHKKVSISLYGWRMNLDKWTYITQHSANCVDWQKTISDESQSRRWIPEFSWGQKFKITKARSN